eukprot:scaffold2364_cov271-Chaetoceros_neogracile.AAC.12
MVQLCEYKKYEPEGDQWYNCWKKQYRGARCLVSLKVVSRGVTTSDHRTGPELAQKFVRENLTGLSQPNIGRYVSDCVGQEEANGYRGELTTFPGGLHPGERPGINGASFTVLTRWRQYMCLLVLVSRTG